MVQTLELQATQDGIIWPRRPLVSSKGLLSCVKNLSYSFHDKRSASFRAVSFNASGDLLAATDERGRIFAFYVTGNRYSLVQNIGTATIYCCFNPKRKTELLVTCEDKTVRCIDVQSQVLISTLRGHKFPAQCAAFHDSGQLALTASQDAVILWDTKDWSRYRVLNAGPGVQEATFVARGTLVAVCFQDDTILMWDLESLELHYRFTLPEKEQSPGLQRITVSDDHQVLVASGRAPFIYVWDFESQTIRRIMELPSPIKQVVRHAFLPRHNTVIGILADDGDVFFVDVVAKNPQVQLEISNPGCTIHTFDIECHSRYLAVSTSDGFLLLYDMEIARETAARAQRRQMKNGLVKLGGHDCIHARPGLQKPGFSDDVDPKADTPEDNHPVPSKLIDSLFGAKYTRQTGRRAKQNRSGATTSSMEASLMRRSSATQANVRTAIGSPNALTTKVKVANDNSPTWRKKFRTRKTSSISRFPAQMTAQEIEVNRKRLVRFLKCNGKYPKKYRVLVWRFLLRLPKNEEAFLSLVAKGKHPVFVRLNDQYLLQDGRTFRRLHRILSAMVYWCPAFGNVGCLPAIVYPFVKIFRENDLAAFETSVSIMLHWCGEFLVSLPYPPVFAMHAIEIELARQDAKLYDHFTQYQVASETYAWSLLETIFTEVLSEDEWMCLWDHLFTMSDTPQLLFVAVLAYLSYFRTALLAVCDRYSIEQFFHQQNSINIQKFIQLMMNLRNKLNVNSFTVIEDPLAGDSTAQGHGRFWPLSRGHYPTFAPTSQFIVDFQISERNRIALVNAQLAYKQKFLDHSEGGSDTVRGRAETSKVKAHGNEDENSRHHLREYTRREAVAEARVQNSCHDHHNRDDASHSNRERKSHCRRNAPAGDELHGNALEGHEPLPRTKAYEFAVHTPVERPLSMSLASVSLRKGMAKASLVEKTLCNFSSRISSHSSDGSMESLIRDEVAVDEVSSTHSIETMRGVRMTEEVKSQDRYAAGCITRPSGKQSSLQAALGLSEVESKAIRTPHATQTVSQEHLEANIAPQAAREITQAQEEEVQFPLQLSVKNEDTTFTPRALSNLPRSQEGLEPMFISQDSKVCTLANNDKLSVLESTTEEDSKAVELAYIPRLNSNRIDSNAGAEQDVAPVDDVVESCDSDSKGNANDLTVMAPLQRPIAELEKRLGICFDDFSDNEKDEHESVDGLFDILDTSEENESIEEDRVNLLYRAKRLLELSSFDTDSNEDL
ncbi:unnamed protein product [Peronospora belbahrii]|uniref:TBC1 domain family member 31 n=1 Tax=Peronospora belbahrii TaxID=622444 RepID=A0AAU9LC40_9STRA|nr:unnamed protein product [Peronospora belbahrii]CAH0514035.1 unnamed protein product [Peronospora belbahrii]